jgi:hypothetical protein
MRRLLFALAFLLLAVPAFAQAQARRDRAALIAVECESHQGSCSIQHLVKYEFGSGRVSRDVILTRPTQLVSYDLGQNHLYRGRYLITQWGDIVDIRKKQFLHDGMGQYAGVEGDRIIEKVARPNLHAYFYYDLKSGKYARLKSPGKWALPGVLAPNETKSVSADSFGNGTVRLHQLNGRKQLLASGLTASVTGCELSKAPLFWLNDETILTQRSDGDLITVDMNGRITPVLTITAEKSEYSYAPKFHRNDAGQIVYEFVSGSYVIDVENKQYSRLDTSWTDLGDGFEWERDQGSSGRLIRFQQHDIGRWWVVSTQTTAGYIAVEYGDVGYLFGKPKGFKVWSEADKHWVTVDPAWLTRLVGWIEAEP